MAISKLILNGVTQMDVTSDTVSAGKLLSGETATKNDGTKVTGSIAFKNATNLTANGSTVTVPSGYYSSQVTKNVASVTHPDPTAAFATGTGVFTAAHAQTAGYVAAGTTTSTYTLTPKTSANVAINGSAITVSSGYYSAQITKNIATVGNASIIYESWPSVGQIRAYYSQSAGFVSESYVFKDMTLPVRSAKTYTPGSQAQYISSYYWLTESLTINPIPSTYVQPSGTISVSSYGIIEPVGSTILALSSYYYTTVPIIVNPIGNYIASISHSGTSNNYLTITKNDGDSITLSKCGTGFTFNQGDSLRFYAAGTRGGGAIYYNNTAVASSPYDPVTYTLTAPSNNLSISAEYATDGKIYVNDVAQGGGGGGEYYDVYKALAYNSSQINSTISSINEYFNTLSIIPYGAFAYRDFSGSFTFSNLLSIEPYAFASFSSTSAPEMEDFNIDLPIIESIGSFAFINNNNLNMVNAPNCSFIGSSAFRYCIGLVSFIAPKCEIIGSYAFSDCRRLEYSYFSNAVSVGNAAFAYCYGAIVYLSLSRCTFVGNSAFYGCSGMRTADLSVCSYIGSYAFGTCSKLSQANFPLCETIGSSAFVSCSSLLTLSIPICGSIGNNAFRAAVRLEEIYLTSVSSVPSLGGSSVFYSTSMLNSIYVPSSLYSSFLTATYWSSVSHRIVSV